MTAPPAPKKNRRSEARRMQSESIICEEDDADSPFTLFFLQLPDADPTHKEVENLNSLFKKAKEEGIMPEWIDSEKVEKIQSSDDFFVVPCFRGRLFRRMAERKLKVYGPPIIFESLEEEKELPQWNHPVFSSVFDGAKVSFTGIEPALKEELAEKVAWMCGVVGEQFYPEITHLVAKRAEQTSKYRVAVQNSVKLMRKEWIDELWELSKTTIERFSGVSRDAVNSYSLRVFEGLEMAITSIDGADRSNLIQVVEDNGGKVPGTMSRSRCSHLISDKTTMSPKYKKAVEWKTVHIVQTRWIRKCIELGHLIDEAKYHPKMLSTEHMRSSTPKRDRANLTESGPDVSSIAGPGGRLNMSSFNTSSSLLGGPLLSASSSSRPVRPGTSSTASSFVASSTLRNDTTLVVGGKRKSDQFSTPVARTQTVPLIRHPTNQSVSSPVTIPDPIDELRKQIDGLDDLFENCMFFVCGVEESRMEKWRRFLDQTGATRVSKFESATNVVVVAPTQQEKYTIRKYATRDDIAIVNVNWVAECVKQRQMVSHEGFEWTENATQETSFSQPAPSQSQYRPSSDVTSNVSARTSLTSFSEPPPLQMRGIFATRLYSVHSSLDPIFAASLREKIQKNGGLIEEDAEKAEFVVFGHSGALEVLLSFDVAVTDLYIDTCISNKKRLKVSDHPLFVPLPRPPMPVFVQKQIFLYSKQTTNRDYVKSIVEANLGNVVESVDDPKVDIVMMDSGKVPAQYRTRCVDLSWVLASVAMGRLQSTQNYRYVEESMPLQDFERPDDVWMKSTREKDTTQEMEEELEDRNRVEDPRQKQLEQRENRPSPLENPHFPDLSKPYRMNLKLDSANAYIDQMKSPSCDSPDSTWTHSKIGSILRKAVHNTGRKNGAEPPEERPPSVVVAENRRTVSSTPVLQRTIERQRRIPEMSDSWREQNREHIEELHRQYAMHPHFLLSISDMSPEVNAELHAAVKSLGGVVDRDFNSDTVILIAGKLGRSTKTLSAIAAGKWCLTPDYLRECVAAGRWLDAEPFEWIPGKVAPRDDIERRLVNVCSVWRIHVAGMPITNSVSMETRHNGAFSGWRCVVHLEDNRTQKVCSILEAGGAIVLSIAEYLEIENHNATIAFAAKQFDWAKQSAVRLKRAGIPLYVNEYIYEFLVEKDRVIHTNFLHPNFPRN